LVRHEDNKARFAQLELRDPIFRAVEAFPADPAVQAPAFWAVGNLCNTKKVLKALSAPALAEALLHTMNTFQVHDSSLWKV
jgi:hypothetical protein